MSDDYLKGWLDILEPQQARSLGQADRSQRLHIKQGRSKKQSSNSSTAQAGAQPAVESTDTRGGKAKVCKIKLDRNTTVIIKTAKKRKKRRAA
jgi:hypothetical protein